MTAARPRRSERDAVRLKNAVRLKIFFPLRIGVILQMVENGQIQIANVRKGVCFPQPGAAVRRSGKARGGSLSTCGSRAATLYDHLSAPRSG
jgi:hypothetical protein